MVTKNLVIILFYCALNLISNIVFSSTNLGTINTIQNGFATIDECSNNLNSASNDCENLLDIQLSGILTLPTTNECIASNAQIKASGHKIPKCPKSINELKGLDNTHPNGGIFALYTGNNDSFIYDLLSNYLKDGSGKFNLVLPKANIYKLINNPQLIKILNNKRINIVEVNTTPKVDRWMQDSFQFTSFNGKPAIYQLEHFRESGINFEDRLACLLAKKCNIPYYIPADMVDVMNANDSSLNSGGNLEVLPGGTFYRGIIKSEGYPLHVNDSNSKLPWQSKAQKIQKLALENAGNKVLDLDTSFLNVAHVDEIINIVKTNQPAPCNFAVLLASPEKAFELMDKSVANLANSSNSNKNKCKNTSYINLVNEGKYSVITDERIAQIYSTNCIDNLPIDEFVKSKEYTILKRENLKDDVPKSINKIMKENEQLIVRELKESSGCQNPKVIPFPVFFRDGLSYTPDLVNGVVQSPAGSPSKVILPRSYFAPFDNYVQDELAKFGVKTTFAHDMGYHLLFGEVHCGTNSARICEP